MADTWMTDTGASARFPVYTRSNASDVLPRPVSPIGASLTFIPGVIEGWRDGNIRQGAFSAEELAGDPNPVCAFFNGYLYVNASVVRVYGERAGAGAAAIDAAFFGNRADTPRTCLTRTTRVRPRPNASPRRWDGCCRPPSGLSWRSPSAAPTPLAPAGPT